MTFAIIKRFVLGAALALVGLTSLESNAQDFVILANGEEIECKLNSVSDESIQIAITRRSGLKKHTMTETYPLNEVYMIKGGKRGTTFIVDGKRIIKPSSDIPKDANIIYLLEGGEIPAWNITLGANGVVSYKKEKKTFEDQHLLASQIFMIKYADDSKDIFNSPLAVAQKKAAEAEAKPEPEPKPELKVVFHTVKKGETLAKIAERYDVSVDDIKEWNDLGGALSDQYRPKANTQLMIQAKMAK